MQGNDQFAAVKAVEHFLERLIADYGLELYMAFFYLSLLVLAWIFVRNLKRHYRMVGATHLGIVPPAFTVPPPVLSSVQHGLPPSEEGDHDDRAFPA